MTNLLRTAPLALVIALISSVPAQAAPMWIFDVSVDATALTQHGYPPSSISVYLQCHVLSAANPALEVGYGYIKPHSVAPSGITPLRVIATPNAHWQDNMPVTYSCNAGIEGLATTGNVDTGALPPSLLPTKGATIVLTLVTAAKKSANAPLAGGPPLTAGALRPSGLVTSPPKNAQPLILNLPTFSAKIIDYGPTEITTCPATIRYVVRVYSRDKGASFMYVFIKTDSPEPPFKIDSFPTSGVVKNNYVDIPYIFPTNQKGTHYVYFLMVGPPEQAVNVPMFRYDVPCGV